MRGLLLALLCAAPALADVYIEEETRAAGADSSETTRVYASKKAMRVEEADGTVVIFRADLKVVRVFSARDKTYGESTLDEVGQPILEAKKSYDDALADYDKQIKDLLSGAASAGGDASGVAAEMKKQRPTMEVHEETLPPDKVAGHACLHVRYTLQGRPTVEVWSPKDIKGGPDLAQFNSCWLAWQRWEGATWAWVKGVPFRLVTPDQDGKPVIAVEVKKVEEKALDASLFDVPKDYMRSADWKPLKHGETR